MLHQSIRAALIATALLAVAAPAAPAALLGPPKTYPAGDTPMAIAVGKINGDGRRDLAVANYFGDSASVLLGAGDGSFGAPQTYPSGRNGRPRDIAVGDLNGDGRRDMVLANHSRASVGVLLGQAGGTFGPPVGYSTGSYDQTVVIADVTGDGVPDLVAAVNGESEDPHNQVAILAGHGDGTFALQQLLFTSAQTWSVAVGDVNRDGIPDLVTANFAEVDDTSTTGVSVFLGRGGGRFSRPVNHAIPPGDAPDSVAIGDLDGDGRPDLAIDAYGRPATMRNLGHGRFAAPVIQAGTGGEMALRDLDGDGYRDLISSSGSVLLGRGDGTFDPPLDFTGGGSLAIADLNADGKPDLATSSSAGATVRLNTGGTTVKSVTPATGPPAGGTPVRITGARFTGATHVRFGPTQATRFVVVSAHEIDAVTPARPAGRVHVRVTAPAGVSDPTDADLFTYGP